jgi:D-amino peptidase
MEGVTGVCARAQTTPGTPLYRDAVQLMHADLAAAVAGCRDAGVVAGAGAGARAGTGAGDDPEALPTAENDAIVVADGHFQGLNLRAIDLPDDVTLAGGSPARLCMMHGLDETFATVVMLGCHARAGTLNGVLDHTFSEDIFMVRAGDDLEIGEIGLNAAVAGCFGVPVGVVVGDERAAEEARRLLPGVRTVVTKTGSSRTAARLLPPARTGSEIRRAVAEALRDTQPVRPLDLGRAPLFVTFRCTRACDLAAQCPTAVREDARTVRLQSADFLDTFRAFLTCLDLAALATD